MNIMRKSESKFMHASLALIVATFLASCGKGEVEATREPAVRPVKLVTIAGAGNRQTRRFPATIGAARMSELSFQVGGLLQELPVKDAQAIEEGALIAKLDQREFRNKVASARAQFQNAEEEYQRAVRLAEQDAIAKSVLEQRQSQRDVAKAQLDTAEKALSDSVLRAPFSGILTQVPVKRLQNVQAGVLIAQLMLLGELEAEVFVPAGLIAQSQSRTDESFYVILDAAPGERIEATFHEATLVADATSQTYAVTFRFKPPEHLSILPGMNATLEITYAQADASAEISRIAVPLAAVLSDGGSQYVWVIEGETMIVSKRRVSIEAGIGETVVVTEGLTPGETIAGAGATYLAEGMKVRPWTK